MTDGPLDVTLGRTVLADSIQTPCLRIRDRCLSNYVSLTTHSARVYALRMIEGCFQTTFWPFMAHDLYPLNNTQLCSGVGSRSDVLAGLLPPTASPPNDPQYLDRGLPGRRGSDTFETPKGTPKKICLSSKLLDRRRIIRLFDELNIFFYFVVKIFKNFFVMVIGSVVGSPTSWELTYP